MELQSFKEFVANADEQQLKAIAFMASWLGEMSPRYCTCSVQCNKTCPIVQGMGEAFQLAASRLE
jgi:hypothetical protein